MCDPEEMEQHHLHLAEVVHGTLQGDSLLNIRTNMALRHFNVLTSRVTSLAPSAELSVLFEEMYRQFLQMPAGKGNSGADTSFRALVRRLVRRIQGALMCLFYLPVDGEPSGYMNKALLDALQMYRSDQTHMTQGVTPELLRKLRSDVDWLAKKMSKNYQVPVDPWIDLGKMHQAIQQALASFGLFPERSSWDDFLAMIGADDRIGDGPAASNPNTIGVSNDAHNLSPLPVPLSSRAAQQTRTPAQSMPVVGPPKMNSREVANIPGGEQIMQLKEGTDLLELVVAKQREEIVRAQAGYDSLYERYTALNSKMFQILEELNAYKLRVDELEGQYKRLDHDWNRANDSIREYNETFAHFDSRVLRLDEHINNIHRQSRGVLTRALLFVLQLLVWVVGLAFGAGVSVVYLFRRKPASEADRAKTQIDASLSRFMKKMAGEDEKEKKK